MKPAVRPSTLADLPGLYRVCELTGPDPSGASHANAELLGHLYVGPYVAADAALCRTVVDVEGCCGYLLGTADTASFEAWAASQWWPPLRERYRLDWGSDPSVSTLDAELIRALHEPPGSPRELLADYPAHLHIDLLDRARGSGLGGWLVRDLIERLRAGGVPGVHLGVGADNDNAIGFYRHLGFVEITSTPGTLWMARTTG